MRDKYYWVNRASSHHIEKMKKAGACTGNPEEILRSGTPRYISMIVDDQKSRDGARTYQFLVEYDIYNPSQGIYFGCKSIADPGRKHEKEITKGLEDWEMLRAEATKRLNNVFVNKDFTYRFKETDNAVDGTFWPFWLSLYEDEDVEEVGFRALRIIAGVYRDLKAGVDFSSRQKATDSSKLIEVRTAFTQEAYDRLVARVGDNVKAVAGPDTARAKSEVAKKMIERFIKEGEQRGLLGKSPSYEMAWCMKRGMPDVEFKALMKALFAWMERVLEVKRIKVPWVDLIGVMMRDDETAYKEQVKTLNLKSDVEQRYDSIVEDLMSNFSQHGTPWLEK